eukprot:278250-Alexandrium_andersonii.AAC.1
MRRLQEPAEGGVLCLPLHSCSWPDRRGWRRGEASSRRGMTCARAHAGHGRAIRTLTLVLHCCPWPGRGVRCCPWPAQQG